MVNVKAFLIGLVFFVVGIIGILFNVKNGGILCIIIGIASLILSFKDELENGFSNHKE